MSNFFESNEQFGILETALPDPWVVIQTEAEDVEPTGPGVTFTYPVPGKIIPADTFNDAFSARIGDFIKVYMGDDEDTNACLETGNPEFADETLVFLDVTYPLPNDIFDRLRRLEDAINDLNCALIAKEVEQIQYV